MPGKRILVVEDDADVGDLLMHVLRSAGYSVDLARTVAQAKRHLSQHGYGLVVTDWRLPDGDGMTIANQAIRQGLKTALLTGYALQMARDKAEHYEVWMKPMRPSELIAAVERCIGEADGQLNQTAN